MVVLEICCDSLQGAEEAIRGGADRIELCSSLIEGGVTPSIGLIHAVRAAASQRCKLHVLVRPRGGDFLYNPSELKTIKEEILHLVDAKVHGVVVGILDREGHINVATMTQIAAACKKERVDLTFHRAFDMTQDMSKALEDLIQCGVPRVLTSGGKPTAQQGTGKLKQLIEQAAGRISVMPAGGITEANIEQLVQDTGAQEVHSSARRRVTSQMTYKPDSMSLCDGMRAPSDWEWTVADAMKVKAMRDKTKT